MGRLCLALVMTCTLLACPFQCMERLGASQVDALTVTSGCRCCARRAQERPCVPRAPAAPEQDRDDGCDCICDGALVADRASMAGDCTDLPFVASVLDPCPRSVVLPVARNTDGNPQRQMAWTGRALRLRLHSLQI